MFQLGDSPSPVSDFHFMVCFVLVFYVHINLRVKVGINKRSYY